MPPNPEVIVKAGIQGLDDLKTATGEFEKQASSMSKIEGITGRVGKLLEGISSHIVGLAMGGGMFALHQQFSRIEASAANIAGYVNSITGTRAGFTGLRNSAIGVQAATGVDANFILQQQGVLANALGMNAATAQRLGGPLASYFQAYGLAGGEVAPVLQAMNAPAAQLPQVLSTLANFAARAGMTGQTAQIAQVASTIANQSLYGLHTGSVGADAGALAAALGSTDRAFRNPDVAATAIGQLRGGLQGAPTNPGLEAAMAMAGINLHDQIRGVMNAANLKKLARFTGRQYGAGSDLEYLFYAQSFGPAAAEAIQAYRHGGESALDRVLHGHGQANTAARARQQQLTLPNAESRIFGHGLQVAAPLEDGIVQRLLNGLAGTPGNPSGMNTLLGIGLGIGGLRGLRVLGRAAKGAGAAGEAAGAAGEGLRLGKALGIGGEVAGKFALPLTAAMALGDMIFTHGGVARRLGHTVNDLLFGLPGMFTSHQDDMHISTKLANQQRVLQRMESGAMGHVDPSVMRAVRRGLQGLKAAENQYGDITLGQLKQSIDALRRSIDKGQGAHREGASYLGAPLIDGISTVAPGLMMASLFGSGAGTSAGGGMVPASYVSPGGGGNQASRIRAIYSAARHYGVSPAVLWGIYGAESTWGKAASSFGLTADYPGTGTSGNFTHDANRSAQILARLLRQDGGNLDRALHQYSGNSYGQSYIDKLIAQHPINLNLYIDGHRAAAHAKAISPTPSLRHV